MEKHRLISYSKERIDKFREEIEGDNKTLIPITYLLDERLNLHYTGLHDVESLIVDITALVVTLEARSDMLLMCEAWINSLIENNNDIYFCVEVNLVKKACDLFYHYFEYDEGSIVNENCVVFEQGIDEGEAQEKNISIVDYSESDFQNFIDRFNSQLYGHDEFKINLERQLKSFILLHKIKRAKIFSILLCGKSGIGKTEVGRAFHNLMFPNDKMIKVNFGNYSGKGSLWSLIGSPKGYVGSEQGGELSKKIRSSSSKIIIIDELDKADESIFTFFYEMLEDGQFTDLDANVYDLDGYIVIFTANLGNNNFQEKIPEPLFSRLDMAYEFLPLTIEDKTRFINEFIDRLLLDYRQNITTEINIEEIKRKVMCHINLANISNLRNIKRNITNEFIDIVGTKSLWNEELNKMNNLRV